MSDEDKVALATDDESQVQQFAWSFARFDKLDANKIAAELRGIQKLTGELTAAGVVDWARQNPSSELFGCFVWDDASAAEKHRESTARLIMRSLRVVVTRGETAEPKRFLVTVKTIAKGYVELTSIKSESAHAALMRQATKDLDAWTKRYAELASHRPRAFRAIQSAVDDLRRELDNELLPVAAE